MALLTSQRVKSLGLFFAAIVFIGITLDFLLQYSKAVPENSKPITIFSLPDPPDSESKSSPEQCPPPSIRWKDPAFAPGAEGANSLDVLDAKKAPRCRPSTPLFIVFASSSCMLEQTLLSYLSEGWPPSQIVVFDNTGVARQNAAGLNDAGTHSFLSHTKIRNTYGVSVYCIPVRLSFTQSQNFLLELARREGITDFYWSHQDMVVRADPAVYPSLFHGVIEEKRQVQRKFASNPSGWAFAWYGYDKLSHINVAAADIIGPWDTLIPYYMSDCDYYGRARKKGLFIFDFYAGRLYDIASCVADTNHFFLPNNTEQSKKLDDTLNQMMTTKKKNSAGRNTWQGMNADGTKSPDFGAGFLNIVEAGKKTYKQKWGTLDCDASSK